MASEIRILPERVANQIAAGEVVQRPASVVKELIENSIDAGATSILVNIIDAGRTSIQIVDDGKGIHSEDLQNAFARHGTSKLSNAEDLFTLTTMGFRGEALASIAAVAHASIRSRTGNCDFAFELDCIGGRLGNVKKVAGSVGTVLTVKHLFFNIPARRQFLKNDAIEFKHITDTFLTIALAQPHLELVLRHNQKDVWVLPPGNARQRVAQILGKKINEQLIPVAENTEVVQVDGFVIRPSHARKKRGDQYLYVNHRPVRNNYLHRAITEAFEGLLSSDFQPGYVLFLRVPSERIDVNIHPAKTEVKFEDDKVIYAILRSAVKRALGIHQVSPTLDFETNLGQHIDFNKISIPSRPEIHVNPSFNPFVSTKTATRNPSNKASEGLEFFKAPPILEQVHMNWDDPRGTEQKANIQPIKDYFLMSPSILAVPCKKEMLFVHIPRARQHLLHIELKLAIQSGKPIASQIWVFPHGLDKLFTGNWTNWIDLLPRLGFQWEGERESLRITAGPYFLSDSEAMEWLQELLKSDPDEDENVLKDYLEAWFQNKAGSNNAMSSELIPALIKQLFDCDNPWIDYKGNKIALILDSEALAAKFL